MPSGTLRVSCPFAVAQIYIARLLPRFLAAYPQIRLDMLSVNRRIDLVEEGIDVALRVRATGDEESSLVTRRLRPATGAIVAHPELVEAHGVVAAPKDLARLPVIGASAGDGKVHWRLTGRHGEVEEVALTPRLATEDFEVLRTAALAGAGAALLPSEYCIEDVHAGRLALLLPDWSLPSATLQAVYVSRRGMVPAVRAFLDFLEENLGKTSDE
jgi:DNA-binding transcriptional LysR family regulator